jgi:DNA-binding transcriptional regulator/RsmH inhibitor MraZ
MDGAGRILIPDFLKHYGNLGNKVVIAGVRNRLELWNEDAWSDYISRVETDIATLSEQLNMPKK